MRCLLLALLILPVQLVFANDFCRGGVHADGVVDFSAAPANPSGPFTVPVRGVPDLTATVTPGPLPPAGTFNGSTITFSRPVKGLTVRLASAFDRFENSFTVTVKRSVPQNSPSGQDFPVAADTINSEGVQGGPFVTNFQANTATFSLLSPAQTITSITVNQITDLNPTLLFIRNLRVQSGDVDLSCLVPRNGLKMWLGNQITLGQ